MRINVKSYFCCSDSSFSTSVIKGLAVNCRSIISGVGSLIASVGRRILPDPWPKERYLEAAKRSIYPSLSASEKVAFDFQFGITKLESGLSSLLEGVIRYAENARNDYVQREAKKRLGLTAPETHLNLTNFYVNQCSRLLKNIDQLILILQENPELLPRNKQACYLTELRLDLLRN